MLKITEKGTAAGASTARGSQIVIAVVVAVGAFLLPTLDHFSKVVAVVIP